MTPEPHLDSSAGTVHLAVIPGDGIGREVTPEALKVLEAVDAEAEGRGEPELAVLVVRQSDGLPGQGWWVGGAESHGHKGDWVGPAARQLVNRLHARAFEHWSAR